MPRIRESSNSAADQPGDATRWSPRQSPAPAPAKDQASPRYGRAGQGLMSGLGRPGADERVERLKLGSLCVVVHVYLLCRDCRRPKETPARHGNHRRKLSGRINRRVVRTRRSTGDTAAFAWYRLAVCDLSGAVGGGRRRRRLWVRPSGSSAGRPCRLSGGPEHRELAGPRQAFDACLLAARGGTVGHRDRMRELDGQPAGRVPTRCAGSMARKPALEINSPTRIKRAVGAAQQIHPGLRHRSIASPQ
jgi:hypothetical protein